MQELLLQPVNSTKEQHQVRTDDFKEINDNNGSQVSEYKDFDTKHEIIDNDIKVTSFLPKSHQTDKISELSVQTYSVYHQYPDLQQPRAMTPPTMFLLPNFMSTPIIPSLNHQRKPPRNIINNIPSAKSVDKDEGFLDSSSNSSFEIHNGDTSKNSSFPLNATSGDSPSSKSSTSSTSPRSTASTSPRSTSSPDCVDSTKKKARTNYTPEQVQALEKVFHEQPYPDPEMMEKLSKQLDIQETKIKVWFQNKRARWRRRQEATNNGAYYPMVPPVISPITPYGLMPSSSMFAATPRHHQLTQGHMMYSGSQSSPKQGNQQQMTSPYHPMPGQLPPYFYPAYPYSMFPQYLRS